MFTEQQHKEALALHGRVELVGTYRGALEQTAYRCLMHNEVHLTQAGAVAVGGGLRCCRGAHKKPLSREVHMARLAEHGRVELISGYVDGKTKALYRCLRHNEIHFAAAGVVGRGRGLRCCKQFGADTLEDAILGRRLFSECAETSLYVYEVSGHPECVKPGISKEPEIRANKYYGPFLQAWLFPDRVRAYLIEQVLLNETRLMAAGPTVIGEWSGSTEVRKMPAPALIAIAQELTEEMQLCADPWVFALRHSLLNGAQRELLFKHRAHRHGSGAADL